jgi:hypothetical protein
VSADATLYVACERMINLLLVLPGGAEQSGDVVLTRERRAARRRLRRVDALSAQLAELHAIRILLEEAIEIVLGGWVQGAWFAVDMGDRTRGVTGPEMRLTKDHPVTGACLVGAVVQAGGGPAAVRSQPVQRALDLVWHSLREDAGQPVRWCPGLPVRGMHVLDLTHWNDAPDRTRGDVAELLRSSVATADAQRERCRSEQAVLAGSFAPPVRLTSSPG